MRAFLIILAAVAGLSASPALAQEAEPTERARELARQYVEILNLQGMMQEQMAGTVDMADEWAEALVPTGPGAPKPDTSADMPVLVPEESFSAMVPMLELMEEVMVEAHAQVFTEAELEALVGFYSNDLGRSIAGKQSELSLRMTSLMMERMPELLGAMGLDETTAQDPDYEVVAPPVDMWSDPTPPLVRQMSPGA